MNRAATRNQVRRQHRRRSRRDLGTQRVWCFWETTKTMGKPELGHIFNPITTTTQAYTWP